MPEPPDFDQIARGLFAKVQDAWTTQQIDAEVLLVAEQLRLVWNARGAADLAKIEAELSSQMGSTAAGPYIKNLDRALRSLDR